MAHSWANPSLRSYVLRVYRFGGRGVVGAFNKTPAVGKQRQFVFLLSLARAFADRTFEHELIKIRLADRAQSHGNVFKIYLVAGGLRNLHGIATTQRGGAATKLPAEKFKIAVLAGGAISKVFRLGHIQLLIAVIPHIKAEQRFVHIFD